ncbi:MAG: hypothetical protein AAF802_29860 [Planctomycetota bacterium]
MAEKSNPYSASDVIQETSASWSPADCALLLLRVAVVLCSAYPLLAILFVHLVVVMEAGLGMRGAIIGSYKTPLSVVFNIAAVLMMGFAVFIPSGFACSFLLRWATGSNWNLFAFPVIYVLTCVTSIGLVLIDPIGVFEYFYD